MSYQADMGSSLANVASHSAWSSSQTIIAEQEHVHPENRIIHVGAQDRDDVAQKIAMSTAGVSSGQGCVSSFPGHEQGYKLAHDQQDGNQAPLTCILSPTFLPGDAKGNVHSGAPPPWLEMDQEKGGILSGKNGLSTDIQILSKNQERKLKKLRNPKRVGAAWAEQRRAELEREINGETSSKNITNDAAWLPNFGRVWQSGSRKDSRKEFEAEKSIESSSLTKRENLVEVQPYISKRMKVESKVGSEDQDEVRIQNLSSNGVAFSP